MSTYIKAGIMTLAAIFLAFVFKSVGVNALGLNTETNALDEYGDLMLEARELFIEQNEDFLELSLEIFDMDDLSLRRLADGSSVAWLDGELVPSAEAFERVGAEDPQALAEAADRLFAGLEVSVEDSDGSELVSGHAQVLGVGVKDGEILYFTGLHELGCVGIAYSPGGGVGGYESIELVEEWKIFYEMAE